MVFYCIAALEFFPIPHITHHTDKLDGIHVKDPFCAGMVAELLVVTGQAQQILQTESTCTQDITLHADPVSVTACHLDYRFYPFGLSQESGSDARHTDHSCLAVCNVDSINITFEQAGFISNDFWISTFGRAQFPGYCEFA